MGAEVLQVEKMITYPSRWTTDTGTKKTTTELSRWIIYIGHSNLLLNSGEYEVKLENGTFDTILAKDI